MVQDVDFEKIVFAVGDGDVCLHLQYTCKFWLTNNVSQNMVSKSSQLRQAIATAAESDENSSTVLLKGILASWFQYHKALEAAADNCEGHSVGSHPHIVQSLKVCMNSCVGKLSCEATCTLYHGIN